MRAWELLLEPTLRLEMLPELLPELEQELVAAREREREPVLAAREPEQGLLAEGEPEPEPELQAEPAAQQRPPHSMKLHSWYKRPHYYHFHYRIHCIVALHSSILDYILSGT